MRLPLVIVLLLFFVVLPTIAHAEVPCARIVPGASVPGGYGVPYVTAAGDLSPLMSGQCSETSFTVEAGNWDDGAFVYKYGYAWNEKLKTWERFEFRGSRPSGEWFQGHASALIARDAETMRGNNYALAYICKKSGSVWRCGCSDGACKNPTWQLQIYSIQNMPSVVFSMKVLPPVTEVLLLSASTFSASPGERVEILGRGFAGSNEVILGNYTIRGVSPQNASMLPFTVPQIPYGRYELRVRNMYDTSLPLYLVVKRPEADAPVVTDISPREGKPGELVTLYGHNFSKEHNEVFVGNQFLKASSSPDGTQLTFRFDFFNDALPPESKRDLYLEGQSRTLPFMIGVANENGILLKGPQFTLHI